MEQFITFADRDRLLAFALEAIPRMFAALIVAVLFWLGYKLTRPPLRRLLQRARFAPALILLLVDGLYKGIVLVLGAVMAASQLGINVAAALAGLGVVGIAAGFAAQETVANMITGFLIFWDRPFKVGDFVTTQDKYGEVREIRTMENTYVVIPNKHIIGELLVNHSLYGEVRVNVPVGIAYKERIADARQVLLPAVRKVAGVLEDPAPDVVAKELAGSSVNLEVRVWTDVPAHERRIFFEVLAASKVALDEADIEIPFPHLQLFVEDVNERIWARATRLPKLGGGAA